eukprot:gnl/Chilomastix_caulleri/8586.p1 GENE.gnl/Chilomastix_caulleri/8586~~gnl/Chilomastix_caulleri/8586.p1  ORF type:complete len:60 (+),score=4.15 gnl/Chilomastix_caulleri/8586:337-516(+)
MIPSYLAHKSVPINVCGAFNQRYIRCHHIKYGPGKMLLATDVSTGQIDKITNTYYPLVR